MAAMEDAAQRRGCRAAWLDTFSFQAPGFYQALGYRAFGELAGYPPGHTRHFLWKPLELAGAAPTVLCTLVAAGCHPPSGAMRTGPDL
jgi:hypothetical protein